MAGPEYTGDPKVHPERMRVNGLAIRGWVVERVTAAGDVLRSWLEPFKPDKVPPGHVARPLVYGDTPEAAAKRLGLPVGQNGPAPEARPPVPPPPPVAPPRPTMVVNVNTGAATAVVAATLASGQPATPKQLHPALQELKRACNMNRNMGNKVIDLNFVIQCLEKATSES